MAGGPPLSNPNIHPELQEAGPSTHPHGPPLLGQHPEAAIMKDDINKQYGKPQSRRRHTQIQNGHIMGSEEWVRQRKDNHVSVTKYFLCNYVADYCNRKKSKEGGVEILTKELTSLHVLFQMEQEKRLKVLS